MDNSDLEKQVKHLARRVDYLDAKLADLMTAQRAGMLRTVRHIERVQRYGTTEGRQQ